MPEPLKLLFVINPVSGGRSKESWETGIKDYFRQTQHNIEIFHTSGKNDKESIGFWIQSWRPDKVVAVGGDGTLKLVAEVVIDTGIPVCIFPAGSANGMARELQMPTTLEDCIHVLLHGSPKYVDIIRLNQENVCIHLSDIGLNAQLVKYFEENDVRGKIGYAREVFRVLWRRRLIQVSIKRDNTIFHRSAFMVVLANARMYGTGARINPLGNMQDGLFEVVILRKLSVIELIKMLFFNRPFNTKKIETIQAESVTIEVRGKAYFQVDGEYLGKTRRISAQTQRNALVLLFPDTKDRLG